jgi:hypothetical protein
MVFSRDRLAAERLRRGHESSGRFGVWNFDLVALRIPELIANQRTVISTVKIAFSLQRHHNVTGHHRQGQRTLAHVDQSTS